MRVLDDQDELAFFRIRSNKHEIMVAPDPEYLLIVVQENVKSSRSRRKFGQNLNSGSSRRRVSRSTTSA